ncbi:MAG: hypothetical protein FK734_07170 [Asgard group archaeon]|nr:hypothetical protein [Asgard group archaeon]
MRETKSFNSLIILSSIILISATISICTTSGVQYPIVNELVTINDAGTNEDAGDTFETAMTLTSTTFTGSLNETDVDDFYVFYMGGNFERLFEMQGPVGTDFDIRIYRPDKQIAGAGLNYTSMESVVIYISTIGYWYIRITNYQGSGDYTVTISYYTPPPSTTPIETTPDNNGLTYLAWIFPVLGIGVAIILAIVFIVRRKTRITDEDRISELEQLAERNIVRTDTSTTDKRKEEIEVDEEDTKVDIKPDDFRGYSFSWKDNDK